MAIDYSHLMLDVVYPLGECELVVLYCLEVITVIVVDVRYRSDIHIQMEEMSPELTSFYDKPIFFYQSRIKVLSASEYSIEDYFDVGMILITTSPVMLWDRCIILLCLL